MREKPYKVYVLIKNDNPIYVGVTTNIKQRIENHKRTKDFDSYVIIKKYDDKKEALAAECGIIRYLSLFKNEFNINGKYEILCYQSMKMGVKNG
jgi:predicted GIY-YIG superfamily endonuclease